MNYCEETNRLLWWSGNCNYIEVEVSLYLRFSPDMI
jgi:hypothetical protein